MTKKTKPQEQSTQGSERPAYLRALGKNDPPAVVVVEGAEFERVKIFKHDSWAATALYACGEHQIVCKLNRQSALIVLPMKWLGYWLARRESAFLKKLEGVSGIPRCYAARTLQGHVLKNAVAHDYIPGEPMSLRNDLPAGFFERLEQLLAELHKRHIAYIDLHKQENVIVGDDGNPHLIDFQISVWLPNVWGFRGLFKVLADSDRYHVEKHRRHRSGNRSRVVLMPRPWWIRCHRMVAVPFRTVRRRFLVLIGVRKGDGRASTEVATEVGLRLKA